MWITSLHRFPAEKSQRARGAKKAVPHPIAERRPDIAERGPHVIPYPLRLGACHRLVAAGRPLKFRRHSAIASARAAYVAQAPASAPAPAHVAMTREVPQPDGKKRIKIPDVCATPAIGQREPFGLFREIGLQLERPAGTPG